MTTPARAWLGPRRRARLDVFALAVALMSVPLVCAAAPEPEPETEPDPETEQAARAQVQAGNAAFKAGDFALAIEHYEAAIALRPAPKLHYNLGVCHQRLSLNAEDPQERTRQGDLAIESYNAYLEQNPQAEDRREIAATIRDLGGTPVTRPTLMPVFEDGPLNPNPNPNPNPAPDPVPDPAPVVDASPPPPHHGRFGLTLAGGYSPTMFSASAIDARAMLALDIHVGGFVGPRRRFLLAAHTSFQSGATLRQNGLALSGYSVGLLGQQTWVVGRETLMFGVGGVAALTGQGLEARAGGETPACRSGTGTRVAGRTGALLAPRFDLGLLLGARRRGMIAVLVQPGFAIFGDGRSGAGCLADETPWTTHGVRRRWQLQLWVGAGFNFRF